MLPKILTFFDSCRNLCPSTGILLVTYYDSTLIVLHSQGTGSFETSRCPAVCGGGGEYGGGSKGCSQPPTTSHSRQHLQLWNWCGGRWDAKPGRVEKVERGCAQGVNRNWVNPWDCPSGIQGTIRCTGTTRQTTHSSDLLNSMNCTVF